MNAIIVAHDVDGIQMIDNTSIRAHQQAATAKVPCGVDSDLRGGRVGSLEISLEANHVFDS